MAAARRLRALRRQLSGAAPAAAAGAALEPERSELQPELAGGLLSDAAVASFVTEGFCVLPNLIEVGDISRQLCDEICAAARADSTFSFSNRATLFAEVSANMNAVLASRTVRGGLQSLLGPGYFMPPWNTHLHVNGVGDQYEPGHTGFHVRACPCYCSLLACLLPEGRPCSV